MQLPLFNDADEPCSFHVDAGELFEAYLACRRNKRNTRSALAFALDYEQNLLELKEEMESGSWQPGRSIAFVVKRPVLREVFAATFRDRVVHHWLMARLNPLFEDLFIDDSYACRVGKGTLYGVRRVASFMDQATCQYTQKAWVLRLDIEGFFMNINRRWLFDSLLRFLDGRYTRCDLPVVSMCCVRWFVPTRPKIASSKAINVIGKIFHPAKACSKADLIVDFQLAI